MILSKIARVIVEIKNTIVKKGKVFLKDMSMKNNNNDNGNK